MQLFMHTLNLLVLKEKKRQACFSSKCGNQGVVFSRVDQKISILEIYYTLKIKQQLFNCSGQIETFCDLKN